MCKDVPRPVVLASVKMNVPEGRQNNLWVLRKSNQNYNSLIGKSSVVETWNDCPFSCHHNKCCSLKPTSWRVLPTAHLSFRICTQVTGQALL